VAEDLALAGRCRRAGYPVRCLGGGRLVRYRMYRGLRGLLEGWSKNLAVGAGSTPLLRALLVAAWVTAVLGGIGVLVGTDAGPWERAGVYLAGAGQLAWHGSRVGRFGPAALLWPVLVVTFVTVFTWSLLRTLVFRRVRWSGRTLRVGASTSPG
jgi:4,4'-diaponeurosporenoate glycosyltransferase